MTVGKDVVLSLLKLTENGPVRREAVARHARVSAHLADQELKKLALKSLFYENRNVIEAAPGQRVRLALHALHLGADFQRVCGLLSWKEFEGIAAEALEANGYVVLKNFRFQHSSRMWEIDLIGLKKPLILSVDCKHWRRGWQKSATSSAVHAQIERTEEFSKSLCNSHKKVGIDWWKIAMIVPVVLSLTHGPYKILYDVPVVPILQLQDFINEVPAHVNLLKRFNQNMRPESTNLSSFCQNGADGANKTPLFT